MLSLYGIFHFCLPSIFIHFPNFYNQQILPIKIKVLQYIFIFNYWAFLYRRKCLSDNFMNKSVLSLCHGTKTFCVSLLTLRLRYWRTGHRNTCPDTYQKQTLIVMESGSIRACLLLKLMCSVTLPLLFYGEKGIWESDWLKERDWMEKGRKQSVW